MLTDLQFAVSITAPIFCVLGLGVLFKRIGWISDDFARCGSELVYKVTLPCLLFVKLVETDFRHNLPYQLVIYALLATLTVFLLLDVWITRWVDSPADRGAFVQGAFRGNLGIIGLAFCISAFGDGIIPPASIYLAAVTMLYNILAVVTLTNHQPTNAPRSLLSRFAHILKNPLLLAIFSGILVSLSGVPVPELLLTTGGYFARMTLPLALLCAGAAIRLREFQGSRPLYMATLGKLLVVPLLITGGGILIGLRGELLGILYLMSSSPAAAASYPMTQAFGGNYHLSAAIIAATSLGAIFSTTLGIFLLRSFQLL